MDTLEGYLALHLIYKLGRHLKGRCQIRRRNDCAELETVLTAFFVCENIYIFSHYFCLYAGKRKIEVRRVI